LLASVAAIQIPRNTATNPAIKCIVTGSPSKYAASNAASSNPEGVVDISAGKQQVTASGPRPLAVEHFLVKFDMLRLMQASKGGD
jgi:hypothetical protein